MPSGKPYVREEDEATRVFYKPYAPFFRTTRANAREVLEEIRSA